jgi:hypothetical protein
MLRVLSLGAGVQSSTLALMFATGEFDYAPDVAIFADTQAEPQHVYDWLDTLEVLIGGAFPIVRVTAGNLATDLTNATSTGKRVATPPVYTRKPDGSSGPLMRQCTVDYKVDPIIRAIREIVGAETRRTVRVPVEQLFGISLDEVQRMRDSRWSWITNRYPLIDRGMSRFDCLTWMERHGYPKPPKSACWFCPYKSDASWRQLRDECPDEWAKAIAFDRAIRTGLPGVRNEAYLHRSLKPLDEANISSAEENGQMNFLNDCEGMCGV